MFRNQHPAWVYVGGFGLTFIAGWANAVGFLSVAHQGITHVTGTVTLTAIELANGDAGALRLLLVLAFFLLGGAVSGAVVGNPTLHQSTRYGWALLLEAALFFGAVALFRGGERTGEYLAAVACGLQNALASSYDGINLRTTHMTGMVTDLGVSLGLAVRRVPVNWLRVRLYAVLLLGFFGGGLGGALAFGELGPSTLVVPGVLAAAGGVGALWTFRGARTTS